MVTALVDAILSLRTWSPASVWQVLITDRRFSALTFCLEVAATSCTLFASKWKHHGKPFLPKDTFWPEVTHPPARPSLHFHADHKHSFSTFCYGWWSKTQTTLKESFSTSSHLSNCGVLHMVHFFPVLISLLSTAFTYSLLVESALILPLPAAGGKQIFLAAWASSSLPKDLFIFHVSSGFSDSHPESWRNKRSNQWWYPLNISNTIYYLPEKKNETKNESIPAFVKSGRGHFPDLMYAFFCFISHCKPSHRLKTENEDGPPLHSPCSPSVMDVTFSGLCRKQHF